MLWKSILVSAIAVGAALYIRNRSINDFHRGHWNRLDRHAPLDEMMEDSFPASDPPSSMPAMA